MNLASTHNSEGYYSPTEFEAMKRLETEERKARRLAAFRPLVYITMSTPKMKRLHR